MLEHFCECYSDLSSPILCPVLRSITPLFIPNLRIQLIRLIGLCASFITLLYSPVPRIQFDPSTTKSQFMKSFRWLPYENINFFFRYRRYLFIFHDIDHISDPYLHFGRLVWYEKLWERVYYGISNS